MVNILVQESSKKICCKKCNYITSRKSQYDRHLLTLRHEKIINDNNLYLQLMSMETNSFFLQSKYLHKLSHSHFPVNGRN